MIPAHIAGRKGARNTASIPADVLTLLNAGRIETVNLCEWLIVDQLALAERVFPQIGCDSLLPALRARMAELKITTAPKKLEAIGRLLAENVSGKAEAKELSAKLLALKSDIARSWGAYAVGFAEGLSAEERFLLIRPFAADPNMSTREIAWLALRGEVIADLHGSLERLIHFTTDPDANIRRFASELTRPRGVWCRHIMALREDPQPGFCLLEPLRADPSKYVRDSVGNWLNDASKNHPEMVSSLCFRWEKQSPCPETAMILKRALRTIAKQP